jgi:hypothetical protein
MVSSPQLLQDLCAAELIVLAPSRTGVLCIILCFALGIANIFHFDIIILWSVLCLSVFTIPP